ncbi:MAG: hypothetical protein NXI31_20390 [bacterium]|nr:hypothetical protein [bacterium]
MSPSPELPDPAPSRRLWTLLCLGAGLLLHTPASAQASGGTTPAKANAAARASATARANGPQTSRSSHSVTHRVVVRNGRTIVDERTENGRPTRGGKGRGKPGAALPFGDPHAEVEKMMERMRREMPRGTIDLPRLDPRKARGGAERARDSAKASDAARTGDSSRVSRTARTVTRRPSTDAAKSAQRRHPTVQNSTGKRRTSAPRIHRTSPTNRTGTTRTSGKITPRRR